MKTLKLLSVLLLALVMAACGGSSSSLDKAVSQVEKALEKVEKNKGKMTEADWKNLEKEVEEPLQTIAKAFENNKLSIANRVKVTMLTAKWAAVVMEAGFSEIEKQTGINRDEWGKELEKTSDELQKMSSDELQKAAEELQKAAEEMQKALQGIR